MRRQILGCLHSTADAAVPLGVAYPSGINGELPKVIEKQGLAERHGFSPSFTFFQYGPPMVEAAAAGDIDVLFTSLNPVASYLAKVPGGLTIIADVGTGEHAIVVPAGSRYHTLSDLEGARSQSLTAVTSTSMSSAPSSVLDSIPARTSSW